MEYAQKVNIIESSISIEALLGLKKGNNTCPACGKAQKFSIWEKFARCWSTGCVLHQARNVIGIYSFIHRLEYRDAFAALAKEYVAQEKIADINKRTATLNRALEVYIGYLHTDVGAQAREYLLSRGFNKATIEDLRIGYAPSNSLLSSYFETTTELEAVGLIKGGREYYSNRVIFPIFNQFNQLVHFTGRYLGTPPKDAKGNDLLPRYKDSRSNITTGGTKDYLALEEQLVNYYQGNYLIITEGYPDAATLYQYGLPSVGLLGLTKLGSHSSKLKAFGKIIFAFDNDRFSLNHPYHPGEYKSWKEVLPQVLSLYTELEGSKLYTWQVPDGQGKDINDWVMCNKKLNPSFHPKIILEQATRFLDTYLELYSGDYSIHRLLLQAKPNAEVIKTLSQHIPKDISPLEYAQLLLK